jgi:hypothetical protein
MSEPAKLPDYPALAAALIVDSRFGYRQELQKDISATSLFLEVKTAQSLATAKLTLELESIDVLVLGPNLSSASAESLLTWSLENSRSKDCAFVCVYDEKPEQILSQCHASVWRPLTKAKLFDVIVRAVVCVNKDSTWSALFNNSDFHRQFDSDVISPLLAPSAKREISEKILNNPHDALGLGGLLRATPEEISRVFKEKNLIFDVSGDPSAELREAAIKFIDALFPNGTSDNERFMKLCTKAVYAWFENAPLGGIKEANEQLKISIWQFKG